MIKINFLSELMNVDDSKLLCRGVIRDSRITYSMMTTKNLNDAVEVLIAVGDVKSITSQSDILERAFKYGWTPVDTPIAYTPIEDIYLKKLHIQASLQALPPRKTAFIPLLFGELGTVLISFLVEAITDSQAVGFVVFGLLTTLISYFGWINYQNYSRRLKEYRQKQLQNYS